jgi:hypothetical protein
LVGAIAIESSDDSPEDFMPDIVNLTPEAEALLRKQFEMDYADAGPKAPYSRVTHKGICIEGRWGVLKEFEGMRKAIDRMPELMARRIARIWCDSNCDANYVVGIKLGLYVPSLKWAVADAIEGHNGISIEYGEQLFGGELLATIEPDWGEDIQPGLETNAPHQTTAGT